MTSAREIRYQGADLVIAWDRHSYPERDRERAIRLGDVAFGPVCTPRHPLARKRRGLAFRTRIDHEFTSTAWTEWQEITGLTVTHDLELRFPTPISASRRRWPAWASPSSSAAWCPTTLPPRGW